MEKLIRLWENLRHFSMSDLVSGKSAADSAKSKLSIASDAVIVVHATLRGKITVGSSTIIHPKAHIDSGEGEIIFGTHNIIEETAVIENL